MIKHYFIKKLPNSLFLDFGIDDHSFRTLMIIMFSPNGMNDNYLRSVLPWTDKKIKRHIENLIEMNIIEVVEVE